jgi:hypothetical protein
MALTPHQIDARGGSRGTDRAAIAAILVFFILAALLVNPLYDTPIYDDWGYGKAVKTLLDEGRFHFTWTATSLLFQVLVGAFFCTLFGFSFSVLHVVTLLFSVLGILALYGWLRRLGRGPLECLLAALATASTLIYFHFTFSFMNDVPALAMCFIALWLVTRAEESGRATTFLLATAALLAAALTRDFILLLVCAFVLHWVATNRPRGAHLWLLASLPLFCVYLVFQRLMITMPHRYLKVSPDFFSPETPLLLFKIICYMGLFFLPLLAAMIPSGLKRGGFLRERGIPATWLVLLVLLSAMALRQYGRPEGGEDQLMPYRPGFISIYGPYNAAPLPGDREVLLGTGARLLLTAASVLGSSLLLLAAGVLLKRYAAQIAIHRRLARLTTRASLLLAAAALLLALLPRAVDLGRVPVMFTVVGWKVSLSLAAVLLLIRLCAGLSKPAPPPGNGQDPGNSPSGFRTAVPVYLFTLALLVYYLATGKFFIRYALLLVPGAVILPFDAFRKARLNRTLLTLGLAVSFALGVVWTRDQISFNEARWAAGHWLLDRGAPVDRIEGGFEWNCWHLEFGGEQPSPKHEKSRHGNNKIWLIPNNLLTLDTFANVSSPEESNPQWRVWHDRTYRKINQFGYYSILQGRRREVQVWKAVGPPAGERDGGQDDSAGAGGSTGGKNVTGKPKL